MLLDPYVLLPAKTVAFTDEPYHLMLAQYDG